MVMVVIMWRQTLAYGARLALEPRWLLGNSLLEVKVMQ